MVDADKELAAEFVVNQTNASTELFGEFIARQAADQELPGELVIQRSDFEELPAEFVIRRSDSEELLGEFISRQAGSEELLGELISRQAGSETLLGEIIVRHSDLQELPAEAIVRHSDLEELPGEFISRQAGSANLLGKTIVRHSTLQTLAARFAVRHVYSYWTDRRLINGVVDAGEKLMGDAKLEVVVEGVMDDIKVWCDAQEVSYVGWTDIETVPRAMKRATTYGTVSALYARYSKTFQGRVVPTLAPVTVTVIGDDEKAMLHWKEKMRDMLELYLSAQESERIWVSTADEEPVFSMDDIPEAGTDRELESWRNWLQDQI